MNCNYGGNTSHGSSGDTVLNFGTSWLRGCIHKDKRNKSQDIRLYLLAVALFCQKWRKWKFLSRNFLEGHTYCGGRLREIFREFSALWFLKNLGQFLSALAISGHSERFSTGPNGSEVGRPVGLFKAIHILSFNRLKKIGPFKIGSKNCFRKRKKTSCPQNHGFVKNRGSHISR